MNHIDVKTAKNNQISTCKYHWYTFIFIFLFEQYKQPNNIYYLLNAIAGYIVIVISPIANVLPIIVVLVFSAFREILEDSARHRSDKYQNNLQYTIVRNQHMQQTPCKDIRQGDILVLNNKEEVPCDALLLRSSNDSHLAYVSTANLDGEVNLKPKTALLRDFDEERLKLIQPVIGTDLPSKNMAVFNGEFALEGNTSYFSLSNVLLRGSRLENTETVYAAVIFSGKETRLMQTQLKTVVKNSSMNQRFTKLVFYQFIASILIMVLFPLFQIETMSSYARLYVSYGREPTTKAFAFLQTFIIFFCVLSYLLPISLFVALEVARMFNVMQVESDKKLRRDDVGKWLDENPKKKIKESPFA